jgi:hypothetical protein
MYGNGCHKGYKGGKCACDDDAADGDAIGDAKNKIK